MNYPPKIFKEFQQRFLDFHTSHIAIDDEMWYLYTDCPNLSYEALKWLGQWNNFSGITLVSEKTRKRLSEKLVGMADWDLDGPTFRIEFIT